MEGVPKHIDIHDVNEKLHFVKGVKAIHDLHIWTLSSGISALSAHIHIQDLDEWHTVLNTLRDIIFKEYQIEHITLQPEPDEVHCDPCEFPRVK